MNIKSELKFVINRLNEAIAVANKPLQSGSEDRNNYEESYPYVAGYSRAAMFGSVEKLQEILDNIQENETDCLFGSDYEKDIDY